MAFWKYYRMVCQSDRMDKYYMFAEELIKKGLAFVCTCKKQKKRKRKTFQEKYAAAETFY